MKLRDLLAKLHEPSIDDGGEQSWEELLDYEVQVHTGEYKFNCPFTVEKVYTDDSDRTLNIDVGAPSNI